MKIKVTGEKEVQKQFSNFRKNMLTKKVMGEMSAHAITLIFENTVDDGKDKTGTPFKEYSNSYLQRKQERGGRFFTGDVNLFDKGEMFGNLTFRVVSSNSAFLHFPKAFERLKAAGHIKGSKILPKRDFFGLTPNGEKEVLEIAENHLEELANG